ATSAPGHRTILGLNFFVGRANQAVESVRAGGLVVAPAAPALLDLEHDLAYREALSSADIVLTDSACMVLFWNLLMRDRIRRVSGLEYLKALLRNRDLRKPGSTFWVMPSKSALIRNKAWLETQGFPIGENDCHIAPNFQGRSVSDPELLERINDERR